VSGFEGLVELHGLNLVGKVRAGGFKFGGLYRLPLLQIEYLVFDLA
jgi:hypothetical protein